MHRLGMIGVAIGVALTGVSCSSQKPVNVLIVMVDTLRADHLSAYGYMRQTSPAIDRFAEEGVLFERARSQASCTFPSVNSLLTSRYASAFLFQGEGHLGIPEALVSLPEMLHARGYNTVAVSASPIVRERPGRHNPNGGFGRGFDVFDDEGEWKNAAYVNRRAFRHLSEVRQPFFMYLHYMDPHDPYRPPERHQRRFAGAYEGHEFIGEGDPNPIARMLYADGPEVEVGEDDVRHLVDLYDEEIAFFDSQFARLLSKLGRLGLLDSTLVILVSDHGEGFLNHGHVKHCHTLFDTSTRTPMILRIPGVGGGLRIRTPVENIDIVPTVFDYLGLDSTGLELSGRTLRTLIEGREEKGRIAFSSQDRFSSVDDGRWKLIVNRHDKTYRLFDLQQDPVELENLYDPESPPGTYLVRELWSWRQTLEAEQSGDLEGATRIKEAELRALGYLQ